MRVLSQWMLGFDMHVSQRGQITIPKALRDRYGMHHNVEVQLEPAPEGILIRKRSAASHPVDRVYGILDRGGSTDIHLERMRGS